MALLTGKRGFMVKLKAPSPHLPISPTVDPQLTVAAFVRRWPARLNEQHQKQTRPASLLKSFTLRPC